MSDEETVHRLRTEPAYREGFICGMRRAYAQHLTSPNPLTFLGWVLEVHGAAIWNELFTASHSSHVVSLGGLTRANGRRVTRGY